MLRRPRLNLWPYSRLIIFELSFVVVLLGFLMTLSMQFAPSYIASARLTEPLTLVRGLQTDLIENAALTGHWDSRFDYYYDSLEDGIIQQILLLPDGHLTMKLSSTSPQIDQQWLGFELSQSGNVNGHSLLRWNCATQHSTVYNGEEKQAVTTISPLVTHPICRE